MSAVVHNNIQLKQLENIKDVREKTTQLEHVKNKFLRELDNHELQAKVLMTYKQELDLLLQEKMAHVEELRQIHADINAMESIIKQTELAQHTAVILIKQIFDEYKPLKDNINEIRQNILGLNNLPELPEIIQNEKNMEKNDSDLCQPVEHLSATVPYSLSQNYVSIPHTKLDLVQISQTTTNFRQQPPPMKLCLSCHQQIHRNAPICPLCKAKSRSRNPKKPKKK